MPKDQGPLDARTAKALLTEDLRRLKQLVRVIYADDPDFVRAYFDGLLNLTHFEVVVSTDDLDLERRDERPPEPRGRLVGFPTRSAVDDAAPDPTKPLPGPIFEYITLGLVKRGQQGAITKTFLIETLETKSIDYVSTQAVTTRLNKMKNPPNRYIKWETGKQNTGLEVTDDGHTRFAELEGDSTRSLAMQARRWLKEKDLWWGPDLPDQA